MSTGVCDDSYLRMFAVSCVVVMTHSDFEKKRRKLLQRFQDCFNIEQRNIIIASPQILNTMPPSLLLEVKVVVSSTSSLAELASNFPTDDSVKRMMDNVFSKFKAQCLRVKRSCRKNALVSFMEFMNQTYLDACNHQALQTPTQSPLKRRRGVSSAASSQSDSFAGLPLTPHWHSPFSLCRSPALDLSSPNFQDQLGCLQSPRQRDQVFIGKTNGSSCRKSRPKPLIQPHSSTRATPCANAMRKAMPNRKKTRSL